jgi:hypothetical protein
MKADNRKIPMVSIVAKIVEKVLKKIGVFRLFIKKKRREIWVFRF